MRIDRASVYRHAVAAFPRLGLAVRSHWRRRLLQFPRILSVELTNRCNASCIMCPRQAMTRPMGIMDHDVYEAILLEAGRNQDALHLFQPFLFGEALLHPAFCDLIRKTRQHLPRPRIYLSTNAAFLDEPRAEAILDARVDKLNVDIDGLTAATAEAIRRNVSLAKVQANVERFLQLRNRRKSPTRLRVSIIRLPQNRHEIEGFVAAWKPVADHVQVVDFNTWLGTFPEDLGVTPDPVIPFDFPCKHPYEELAIAWDGRATLCCLDFDLRHPVGDLRRDSIRKIWRGGPMSSAREALEEGRVSDLSICRGCNAAKFQQRGLWRWLWRPADGPGREA